VARAGGDARELLGYTDSRMSAEARIEKSKFELGAPDEAEAGVDEGELPWAYGEDRITALVRDPDSAYLYWEITDDGIAGARARLGPAGAQGWCNLRIYDVTGRDFDGTNANDYFDIRVERTDREHFVMARRPGSAMSAEIGIKTHEGYFQPIARSGRADFPRSGPSPNTSLEWMTVTSEDAPPSIRPYQSRHRGPDPMLPRREGAGYFDVWRAAFAPSMPELPAAAATLQTSSPPARERHAPRPAHVERWWKLDEWRSERPTGLRFATWVGSREEAAWRAGPFPLEPSDPDRLAIALLGDQPLYWTAASASQSEAGFVAYGPWRVVVQSYDIEPTRRVIATWSMRWVQATTPLADRWSNGVERKTVYGYEIERGAVGASEALVEREWSLGDWLGDWLGGGSGSGRGLR
jgi:hypothetical protein